MKRHEALAPLSREHHTALILAQLLKKDAPVYKGMPTLPKDKAVYAINFFKTKMQKHFLLEEEMLHKIKHCHFEIDKLATEIIKEHRQLSATFTSLEFSNDITTLMDNLGSDLENHIRKEERILFPLIQTHCSEEILKIIAL